MIRYICAIGAVTIAITSRLIVISETDVVWSDNCSPSLSELLLGNEPHVDRHFAQQLTWMLVLLIDQ